MPAHTTATFQPGRTSLNWQPLQDHRLFERLCAFIFSKKWGDPNVVFVGHPGKSQLGLDLYGFDSVSQKRTGIQCKNYTEAFTIRNIDDVLKVIDDKGNTFGIQHLIIALPLKGNARCQAYAAELSAQRAASGHCTLSLCCIADIDHERSLIDAVEITNRFPELLYGLPPLQSSFPVQAAYSEILDVGKRAPLHEGKQVMYNEFITKNFFSAEYREHNQHIALPIEGVHPRKFWVEIYCKAPSNYFRECHRSVHIEGFDLRCGSHESLHEIWSLLPGCLDERSGSNAEHAFMISSGILQASLLRLREALRAAGAIRMVSPTCVMSDVLRDFLLKDGFTEAKRGEVLVDMP